MLYAVRPNYGYFDLSPPGRVHVASDGATSFEPEDGGPHRYSILRSEQQIRVRRCGPIGKSTAVSLCSPPLKLHAAHGVSEEPLQDEVRWAFGKCFVRGWVALLACYTHSNLM